MESLHTRGRPKCWEWRATETGPRRFLEDASLGGPGDADAGTRGQMGGLAQEKRVMLIRQQKCARSLRFSLFV